MIFLTDCLKTAAHRLRPERKRNLRFGSFDLSISPIFKFWTKITHTFSFDRELSWLLRLLKFLNVRRRDGKDGKWSGVLPSFSPLTFLIVRWMGLDLSLKIYLSQIIEQCSAPLKECSAWVLTSSRHMFCRRHQDDNLQPVDIWRERNSTFLQGMAQEETHVYGQGWGEIFNFYDLIFRW